MTKQSSITGKEPWLAVILSSLFPGIGQIYAGQKIRGVILIISSLCLLFFIILFGLAGRLAEPPGVQFGIMFFLLVIFNLFDAHRCAIKANHPDFERIRKSEKDPWLAVFLSRVIPGLGHAYLGEWEWASLFFILLIIVSIISIKYGLIGYLLGSIVLPSSCVYHAYMSAKTTRPKSPQLILRITLVLLLLQLPGPSFKSSFEARYIPSGAMLPTLEINDRILINKGSYRFKKPQRGDIIVFNPTAALRQENFKDPFIKRVIGLPGDKVEVKDGKVYINDQILQEDYIEESPNYDYGPAVVPENSYFVLGDNRNNSYDSHYWGFVPEEDIIGKATKRYWPVSRIGNL